MGAKKEALILKAIAERRQHAGRHLIGHACVIAETLVEWLREAAPEATYDIVGSLRRGAETSGDIDILATGAPAGVLEHFTRFRQVERVLGLGDTKASVLLKSQCRPTSASSRPSRAARRCSTSPARRRTTSPCGSAPWPRATR